MNTILFVFSLLVTRGIGELIARISQHRLVTTVAVTLVLIIFIGILMLAGRDAPQSRGGKATAAGMAFAVIWLCLSSS